MTESKETNTNKNLKSKSLLVVAGLALIVISILGFIFFSSLNRDSPEPSTEETSAPNLQELADQGSYQELITKALSQLEDEDDPARRSELYGQLIAAYENIGEQEEAFLALERYMKEDDVQPGYALQFAEYLDTRGDNDRAIEYYEIALDELDDQDAFYPEFVREIELRIEELSY